MVYLKSNLLRLLELISISAQGKLGKYIQSVGGMEPIVWDGAVTSVCFTIETTPEGGDLGGNVIFSGSPEDITKCKKSYTGQYLKKVL